jgi:hypothetical protein
MKEQGGFRVIIIAAHVWSRLQGHDTRLVNGLLCLTGYEMMFLF